MRSMRLRAKPQLWAMSVALEAQGETVPKRGVTMNSALSVSFAAGWAQGSP